MMCNQAPFFFSYYIDVFVQAFVVAIKQIFHDFSWVIFICTPFVGLLGCILWPNLFKKIHFMVSDKSAEAGSLFLPN